MGNNKITQNYTTYIELTIVSPSNIKNIFTDVFWI